MYAYRWLYYSIDNIPTYDYSSVDPTGAQNDHVAISKQHSDINAVHPSQCFSTVVGTATHCISKLTKL